MTTTIHIIDGPLRPHTPDLNPADPGGAGAVLAFEGIVRPLEDNRPLLALDYTIYEPMATLQLTRLAGALITKHNLLSITAWHSRGRVRVGQSSFRLIIRSHHRAPALAAMSEFIDRLKQDVPIWKTPIWKTPDLINPDRPSPPELQNPTLQK